jgi:hypothetical protein
MGLWKSIAATALLTACVVSIPNRAWALQDDPPERAPQDPKDPEPGEEENLTPDDAMAMLREIHKLMGTAEELLHGASLGKGALTQEEILKLLKDVEKMDPSDAQKKVLELINKLLSKSEKNQKDVIERITELIKKSKSQGSSSESKPGEPKPGEGSKPGASKPPKQPGSPATSPYNPNRTDPPSKFRSLADRRGEWGALPPKERDSIIHELDRLHMFQPEYQEQIRNFFEEIMKPQR